MEPPEWLARRAAVAAWPGLHLACLSLTLACAQGCLRASVRHAAARCAGRGDRRAQRPSSLTGVARDALIPRVASPAIPVGWSTRFGLTIVSFRQARRRPAVRRLHP